jgi:hypothetical protein
VKAVEILGREAQQDLVEVTQGQRADVGGVVHDVPHRWPGDAILKTARSMTYVHTRKRFRCSGREEKIGGREGIQRKRGSEEALCFLREVLHMLLETKIVTRLAKFALRRSDMGSAGDSLRSHRPRVNKKIEVFSI